MIDLTGKTALVTGGSRGIGRASALLLAEAGANLVIGYRSNREAAESIVETIRRKGKHAVALSGDISRKEAVVRLMESARDTFGALDILVANAGIWKEASIETMSEQQWQEMIDVNLKSVYLLCHLAVPEMKARRQGCLVLVGSTAGQRGEPFHSHYAASKGAIMSFTKSLAGELGPYNVRVNCVAPGWVDTEMCEDVFKNLQFKESVRQGIPLKRIATAEDIAGAILFLASDLARHVHGEVLNVNGGSVLCG